MGTREILLSRLFGTIWLSLGVVGLFWPQRVRSWGLEGLPEGRVRDFIPFLKWIQNNESTHIWIIRYTGAIAILALALLLAVIIRNQR